LSLSEAQQEVSSVRMSLSQTTELSQSTSHELLSSNSARKAAQEQVFAALIFSFVLDPSAIFR
jgi:hypothetical protein